MRNPHTFLLLLFFLFSVTGLEAQSCGSCSVTINSRDTLNYVIGPGQTFCIDTTGQFEGSLLLNGGTICNRGIFSPKNFTLTSGAFSNYSIAGFNDDVTLLSALSITNDTLGTLTVDQDLILSGGSISNSGITIIKGNITFNTGTFGNSAIVTCHVLSGAGVGSISNSGVINKD